MNVRTQIEQFEGRKNAAYPDPLTHGAPWTIGVGHTGPEVHEGLLWTDQLIDQTLDADIAHVVDGLRARLPWFARLSEARQAVLINMAFQMGLPGLMKFQRTLGSVRDERWNAAAGEMLASAWAQQTPSRAARLARQMETGSWE